MELANLALPLPAKRASVFGRVRATLLKIKKLKRCMERGATAEKNKLGVSTRRGKYEWKVKLRPCLDKGALHVNRERRGRGTSRIVGIVKKKGGESQSNGWEDF